MSQGVGWALRVITFFSQFDSTSEKAVFFRKYILGKINNHNFLAFLVCYSRKLGNLTRTTKSPQTSCIVIGMPWKTDFAEPPVLCALKSMAVW